MQPLTLSEIFASKPVPPVGEYPGKFPEGYSSPDIYFQYAEKVRLWAEHLQQMEEYTKLRATFEGLLMDYFDNGVYFSKLNHKKRHLVLQRVKQQFFTENINIFYLTEEQFEHFVKQCEDLTQFLLDCD